MDLTRLAVDAGQFINRAVQMNHMQSLNEFVEAQTCYFDECNQLSQELQKQLESIPAVLCSNNWQSAITDGVDKPSTDNRVLDEVNGSNRDNPVLLQRIPDFDQDSWTEPQKMPQNGADLLSLSNSNFNNNNTMATEIQGNISVAGMGWVSEHINISKSK
uniref:Uncharacterized protein n=1 Tax=Knipowitschia caucasica TaxID=637954 RepID=A0AAV2JDI4_KNICA